MADFPADITRFHTAVETLLRRTARDIILPHYRSLTADQIEEKATDDLVTVADRLAEEMLAEGLEAIIPGLPIVGEEAAHADPAVLDRLDNACWIVDPIDGTNNYASGAGPFGIIVAMADGGLAHSAWLYDPVTDRVCTAHIGEGAFVNGERISAQTTGETPPIAALAMGYMDDAQRETMNAHIVPHYQIAAIPRCAAEQYPRLALGQNDVSIFHRTLPWDHAAGILWLNEAGGKAARPNGDRYRVNENGRSGLIGAASPALFDEMAALLAAADAAD